MPVEVEGFYMSETIPLSAALGIEGVDIIVGFPRR